MNTRFAHVTDEWLVLMSQAGQSGAFESLVCRWQARLWRHARCLVGSDAAASDVLQESWLSIVRGLPRLVDPATFPAWAFRIVTRRALDLHRRRARRADAEHRFASETREDGAADDEPDERQALKDALRRLPPDELALILLRYCEDMSLERIAEVMRVPIGTIKSRLHRIRRNLRRDIERSNR